MLRVSLNSRRFSFPGEVSWDDYPAAMVGLRCESNTSEARISSGDLVSSLFLRHWEPQVILSCVDFLGNPTSRQK